MRSTFQVHGAKTGRLPPAAGECPKAIQLSAIESGTLAHLTQMEQSALDFWKEVFHIRGIVPATNRVCMMVYRSPGYFELEWHRKALGPKAIAAGKDYCAFAERKDREFNQRKSQQ
jgi:hypothetical protein